MLDNFSLKLKDHKQRVNEKQNDKVNCSGPRGTQGKCIKYIRFPWFLLEVTM